MSRSFDKEINRQVQRLRRKEYRALEKAFIRKRLAWIDERYPDHTWKAPSPRIAYELLFFDYMGLTETDVPVLSESESSIVWSSVNRCPTLEACGVLGLDTRKVCRAVNEKATQAFVSRIDPQLRFLRSYQEIRPHALLCKETIFRMDFEAMMRLALEEAGISLAEGNKGYGAVVVLGDRILALAHDTAVTQNDPSRHAEVNAIRRAVDTLGDSNLCGAVLFSTCEPCPMCSSLAVWANLTSIVYGVSIDETARMGKSRIRVSSRKIIRRSPVMVEVIGDVLHDACRAFYE